VAEPATVAEAVQASTGKPGEGFVIQLSAVRSEADAKTEWARVAKKFPELLGGMELVIQRADLGAKGVFYRVRGGWLKDRAEAKALCDRLAERNVGCIVAKP
ncbi:MAG: SPOR domain-containing protein, partial [Alphaproteobacteria bacterium]|nr:SPOR domain-containing protein [Alphaproteobacteria bacterium]